MNHLKNPTDPIRSLILIQRDRYCVFEKMIKSRKFKDSGYHDFSTNKWGRKGIRYGSKFGMGYRLIITSK